MACLSWWNRAEVSLPRCCTSLVIEMRPATPFGTSPQPWSVYDTRDSKQQSQPPVPFGRLRQGQLAQQDQND
jgi:hypothetical protein